MTDILAFLYLACFQFCALPAIVRVCRRKSSEDLSVWREWLLVVGVSAQFVVMWQTGADWRVIVSPVLSGISIVSLLGAIYWYRRTGIIQEPGG